MKMVTHIISRPISTKLPFYTRNFRCLVVMENFLVRKSFKEKDITFKKLIFYLDTCLKLSAFVSNLREFMLISCLHHDRLWIKNVGKGKPQMSSIFSRLVSQTNCLTSNRYLLIFASSSKRASDCLMRLLFHKRLSISELNWYVVV